MSVKPKPFIKTENFWRQRMEAIWMMRQSLVIPLVAVVALTFGSVFGLLATRLSLGMGIFALVSLAAFWLAFYRPEFVILFILAMSSTIFNVNTLPRLGGFSSVDLFLMFLLGLLLVRVLARKDTLVRTPLDWPILLFFVAGTIANLNGMFYLGTVDTFRNSVWRILMNYLVFFAVTNFVKTRQQLLTLVGGMFVMATIVAAFIIAQQAVGTSASIIPGMETVHEVEVLGEYQAGVARVNKVPGFGLVFVMLLPAFILHTIPEYLRGRKGLSLIPVIFLPLAIAFTFDRNMWIGAALGGAIFILMSRFESRRFIGLILALAISVTLLIPLFNVYFPRIDTIVGAISARFDSLFAGDELVYDHSTQWRLMENEYAIPKFLEYPVLGLGPQAEYRPPIRQPKDSMTYYIHNGYLWLLVDTGIVGFLPFLWFSILFLIRGFFSWYSLKNPILKGIIIGFSLSYIAIMSSTMTSPRVLAVNFVPLIGVMLGINEVAIRLEQQSSRRHTISSDKELEKLKIKEY